MESEYVSYAGWPDNLRLRNSAAELIVTLNVGPRVIAYRTEAGRNVFKNYAGQMGGAGEKEWKIRGGHRFWLAPEDRVLSYLSDNSEVQHRLLGEGTVELTAAGDELLPIRKTMTVSLDGDSSCVTVTHLATNEGSKAITCASWGLTVMEHGGTEIIPLPPPGEHPRDLLPARRLVVWPFTDMSDARWHWGRHFITLKSGIGGPTKLGLTHTEGWVAYQLDNYLFIKTIPFHATHAYADLGCNFETFSNEEMLEVEALGPMVTLEPGEATGHTEHWFLFEVADPMPDPEDEAALAEWVQPFATRVEAYLGR